jgi:hypothetical protein
MPAVKGHWAPAFAGATQYIGLVYGLAIVAAEHRTLAKGLLR